MGECHVQYRLRISEVLFMENQLEKSREEIDRIDAQIAELFEERFTILRDIIAYKVENHLPVLDTGREENIIATNSKRIQDDDIRKYFKQAYMRMIELSRQFQEEILDDM